MKGGANCLLTGGRDRLEVSSFEGVPILTMAPVFAARAAR